MRGAYRSIERRTLRMLDDVISRRRPALEKLIRLRRDLTRPEAEQVVEVRGEEVAQIADEDSWTSGSYGVRLESRRHLRDAGSAPCAPADGHEALVFARENGLRRSLTVFASTPRARSRVAWVWLSGHCHPPSVEVGVAPVETVASVDRAPHPVALRGGVSNSSDLSWGGHAGFSRSIGSGPGVGP
jgi:hypothetical protein